MFLSNLPLIFRNIFKYKSFTAINILGLGIAMAACFIILQYVAHEYSFDRFHPQSSSVYRITLNTVKTGGDAFHTATTFLPVAPAVKDEYPEVEDYLRLYFLDRHAVVSYEKKQFEQEAVLYADANFFQFLSYGLIQGDPAGVLRDVNTVAMSESAARRYFESADPVGKVIKLSEEFNDMTLLVTGIFKDPPANSHLRPHMVVSMSSYENLPDVKQNQWNWPFYMNYIRLREGTDPHVLEQKLPSFVSKYIPKRDGRESILSLQPLEDIHLNSKLQYEIEANGDAQLVLLLVGVAIMILLIAYANYVNLSTARSIDRAKEVGIRKTLGARAIGLMRVFLTEAIVINLMALVVAVGLVQLSRQLLVAAGVSIDVGNSVGPVFWVLAGIGFVLSAVLSSIYPALVLSSFQPIAVLRGRISQGLSGQSLRKSLVLLQFTVSIGLMIAAYAIYSQMQFMRSQPLGMDIHNLLIVKGPRINNQMQVESGDDPLVVKSMNSGTAASASVSNSVPGVWTSRISGIVRQGSEEGKNNSYNFMGADDRFIDTYRLELLAGRNFQSSIDTAAFSVVIINESASKLLGFSTPEEAVSSNIAFRGRPIRVIGVIKDYHHFSLKAAIDPLLLYPIGKDSREYYSIRLNANTLPLSESIAAMEEHWKSVYPDNPFEYFFLDSSFDAQYKADLQFEKLFTAFSFLTVFIACLGLYGLASFVTTRRTREIGIRKVLGSSVKDIVLLLLSDFSRLIAIAGLVAIPLAYIGIQNWQLQFAFREDLSWWIYALPVILIMAIAVITICIHTVKVALVNPVEILKRE